jgi:hypothetical protein
VNNTSFSICEQLSRVDNDVSLAALLALLDDPEPSGPDPEHDDPVMVADILSELEPPVVVVPAPAKAKPKAKAKAKRREAFPFLKSIRFEPVIDTIVLRAELERATTVDGFKTLVGDSLRIENVYAVGSGDRNSLSSWSVTLQDPTMKGLVTLQDRLRARWGLVGSLWIESIDIALDFKPVGLTGLSDREVALKNSPELRGRGLGILRATLKPAGDLIPARSWRRRKDHKTSYMGGDDYFYRAYDKFFDRLDDDGNPIPLEDVKKHRGRLECHIGQAALRATGILDLATVDDMRSFCWARLKVLFDFQARSRKCHDEQTSEAQDAMLTLATSRTFAYQLRERVNLALSRMIV